MLKLFFHRYSSAVPDIDYNRSKFLFIRQDRIGDVLVSTPIFRSLHRHYPNALIDILLSNNNSFVLDNTKIVRRKWIYKKKFDSMVRLIAELRREKYDFVIDLMDNPSATSTVLLLVAGGKWNVGLSKENAFVYDLVVPLLSRKDVHIVDRLAELLKVFKIDPEVEELRVHYDISPENMKAAERDLSPYKEKYSRIIGINISAGSENRFWGIDNYRSLIEKLRKFDEKIGVIILFKGGDEGNAREITDDYSFAHLVPTATFDYFAAILSKLDFLITPDTSAVHLASAFQIPAVVLYVQSNKDLRIWDPYKSPAKCVVTATDELRTIPIEEVFSACKELDVEMKNRN